MSGGGGGGVSTITRCRIVRYIYIDSWVCSLNIYINTCNVNIGIIK